MNAKSHVQLMLTAHGITKTQVLGAQRGEGASLRVTWKSASMREHGEMTFYFPSAAIADYARSFLSQKAQPAPSPALPQAFAIA